MKGLTVKRLKNEQIYNPVFKVVEFDHFKGKTSQKGSIF